MPPWERERGTHRRRGALTQMATEVEKLCAFCRTPMQLERELPSTAESHTLRYFMCGSCGAGEWQAVARQSGAAGSDEPVDGENSAK